MPHVNSGGGDDLASTDEVKVYKDEGDEEKRSSENLSEDKLGLVTETEVEGDKSSDIASGGYPGSEKGPSSGQDGKPADSSGPDRPNPLGYVVTPYPYPNGASLAGSLGNKVSVVQPPHPGALASFMMYNNEHFTSPPPAHMGIPPVHVDPKTVNGALSTLLHLTGAYKSRYSPDSPNGLPRPPTPTYAIPPPPGLPRPPMYAIPPPPGQFPHPLYSPEFSQVQWTGPPGYPITSGFRGPYPTSLNSSMLARFSPPSLIAPHHSMHPGMHPPAIITPGPKQEIPSQSENHRHHHTSQLDHATNGSNSDNEQQEKRRPYVKKPLNAFMLFMKEHRAKIVAEGTLKESAAINQILGRKWHALDRSEQAKYYDMARKEKELHMQLYPGWSARDNYATHTKKKKRKRETPGEPKALVDSDGYTVLAECSNPKKCRARFGLDAQNQWCKPCRRKKKCIRFLGGDDGANSNTDGEDGDDMSNSIATIDSTTDGDSDLGSPQPSSTTGDDNVQHPAVSQSQPSQQLSSSSSSSSMKPEPQPESSQSQQSIGALSSSSRDSPAPNSSTSVPSSTVLAT